MQAGEQRQLRIHRAGLEDDEEDALEGSREAHRAGDVAFVEHEQERIVIEPRAAIEREEARALFHDDEIAMAHVRLEHRADGGPVGGVEMRIECVRASGLTCICRKES